ncbi:MAG: hypothetical protein QNJ94_02370 [Alphaproteobacteria bacterium]|nr:hypothetical protein [Alphaproteobacteria bacterium]
MEQDRLKNELLTAYQRFYVEGFKTNDVRLIDKIVSYPLVYLKDGLVEMVDHYPIDPAKLKIEKEWDHSTDWRFDIPAISDRHAHAVASATRCRADGSVIEHVHGFYAFTKVDNDWKMYALAEITY